MEDQAFKRFMIIISPPQKYIAERMATIKDGFLPGIKEDTTTIVDSLQNR